MSRGPLPLTDHERLIFALDVPGKAQALEWIDRLDDAVSFYKIGMELLGSGEYFDVLDELARRNKRIFVDLKFFDIPATVGGVIKRLSQWPVDYCTIHGWHPAMMEAAAAAAWQLPVRFTLLQTNTVFPMVILSSMAFA